MRQGWVGELQRVQGLWALVGVVEQSDVHPVEPEPAHALRQAAAHSVEDRTSLLRRALLERQEIDVENVRVRDGLARAHGTDATGAPSGANSAGQPPVWMNTTSSPSPNRPSPAAPSSPEKPLPEYVRSINQPP